MYIHHTPIDTYDQYYDCDNYRFLVVKGLVNIHRPHEHCSIIQFLESLNLEQPGVPMGPMGPGSLDIPGGLWEIWRLG